MTRGIPHLTAVNPYIASALGSASAPAAAATGRVLLPRQQGCSPSFAAAAADAASAAESANAAGAVGISGFAFQGTNAHVITGRSDIMIILAK